MGVRRVASIAVVGVLALGWVQRSAGDPPASVSGSITEMLVHASSSEHPVGAGGVRIDPATRELLRRVYAHRKGTPLWSRDEIPTPQSRILLQELRAADSYGLRPGDYVDGDLGALFDSRSVASLAPPERWARFDVGLSAVALRFAVDVHFGRVSPRAAGFELNLPRPQLDLGAFLEQLAAASDVHQTLASIEPTFYHYRLLEQTLQRYRRLAIEQQALPALPLLQRRSVKPGEYYVGAPQLRNLLRLLGDLPGRVPASATAPSLPAMTLDPELVAGLQHFQIRHGLAADGTLGKTTFTALATPLTRRVRQIELTLERWRWLPPFDTPPIIVNIPEFRLFAFRGTQDRKSDILQMDVIVGRTYLATQTPVFAADMRYVIFRPYWEVPYSIAKREMLPLIRADSRYLSAQHLQIVSAGDSAGVALAPTAANIDALATGRTRLRQAPGPDNALGLIKFMLPNAHNVYLHATPAHRLFGESRRAFSHGCIRVSDPVALAVHVLRNASDDWTAERIEAAMNGASTLRVDLARPIRVLIVYGTVLAMESGDVYFFDDIYGHDRKLESLLGLPAT